MDKEAHIEINGVCLNGGQSMAVRIAVQSFFMEMEYSGLGKDEHGIMLADLYKRRLGEVADLIYSVDQPR